MESTASTCASGMVPRIWTVHATWSKESQAAPIHLLDDSGVVVRLPPGNSWVELVPDAGAVGFAE